MEFREGPHPGLAINTKLATPHGWTTVGDVHVGQRIISGDGSIAEVTRAGVPHTSNSCFRIIFNDRTIVVASSEQLWLTALAGSAAKPQIRTTISMVEDGRTFKVTGSRPWKFPEKRLDIDPYVLGAWLGDGDKRNATISVGVEDVEESSQLIRDVGYTVRLCETKPDRAELMYVSVPGSHRNRFSPVRGLKVRLADANLINNKHIPPQYLRSSIDQRTALLQGLMDTDGSVTPTGHCTFVNSTPEIIEGIVELLRSFGEDPVASFVLDKRSRHGGYWKVTFTPRNIIPFRLSRKVERLRASRSKRDDWVRIRSIEAQPPTVMRAIAIGSPSRLGGVGDGCRATLLLMGDEISEARTADSRERGGVRRTQSRPVSRLDDVSEAQPQVEVRTRETYEQLDIGCLMSNGLL